MDAVVVGGLPSVMAAREDGAEGSMTAGPVRHSGGERAGKPARLRFLGDVALVAPAAAALVLGAYSGPPTLTGALFILLAAVSVVRSGLRRQSGAARPDPAGELMGGLAGLVALLALVEQLGPWSRDVYPLVYALVAFGSGVSRRRATGALVVAAAALELGIAAGAGWTEPHAPMTTGLHLALLAVFGGLGAVLGGLGGGGRRLGPARSVAASVEDDTEAAETSDEDLDVVEPALSLLRETCGAGLVAFLERGGHGQLEVVASTDPAVTGRLVGAREGIPASVLSSGQAVLANRLRGVLPGTLDPRRPPRHVLAAPVGAGRRPEGVLVLERREEPPFDELALRRAELAARLLGASLSARRRIARVTDAHWELERFFDASRLLNSALTPEQVYASTHEALGRIDQFAFAAVTWAEEAGRPQRIVHARGAGLERRAGERVDQERTLAAMVVKNGHYLPLGCEHKPDGVPVLASDEVLDGVRSVIVLPLRVHAQVRGALAVGSTEPGAFPDARRGILEVIANQLAISLANARSYAHVQELATLDALTGVFNRGTFERRLDEGVARAVRAGRPLTLVLLDIDHFKTINDTHGHPVGDAVLRELGAAIRRLLRRSDLAARYGGEEFALILEDTDSQGGLVMAERLREEAARIAFSGAGGQPFRITVSLGIAAVPLDADGPKALLERADGALYESKRGGRNQARLARSVRPALATLRELRAS
jgi:diguanylate cyclase (GGDEF)-like protein